MRPVLFIATLIPVLFSSAAFGADSLMPLVAPEIELSVQTVAPYACEKGTRGMITLDSKAHLCICDGDNWTVANSTEPCAWTPAAPR